MNQFNVRKHVFMDQSTDLNYMLLLSTGEKREKHMHSIMIKLKTDNNYKKNSLILKRWNFICDSIRIISDCYI